MGLTPSSRDEAQQTTSSGQPAQMSQGTLQANLSDASGTNQVSGGHLLLYGDHDHVTPDLQQGLNPQEAQAMNSEDQEILNPNDQMNTANLTEGNDQQERSYNDELLEIRQLEESKQRELALLRAERLRKARRNVEILEEEKTKLSQEIRGMDERVARHSQQHSIVRSETVGPSTSGLGRQEASVPRQMEHPYVTNTADRHDNVQRSPLDINSVDAALKYLHFFDPISAKVKPSEAVRCFEGQCEQFAIQNKEQLKLHIAMKIFPQEVILSYSTSVDKFAWSYAGLRNTYLKRDTNLPPVHQSYPVWSAAPEGHVIMIEALKRASCTKEDLVKFFAMEMSPKAVRKLMMNEIHSNIEDFERKLNTALAITQERPAPVVFNRGPNFNRSQHPGFYVGLRDGLCWKHKEFGRDAFSCVDDNCRERKMTKNANPSS